MKTKQNNPTRIYRAVACSDRLPKKSGKYNTDKGYLDFTPNKYHIGFSEGLGIISPKFWYEEVELPSEDEIGEKAHSEAWKRDIGLSENNSYETGYWGGASFILNHIKGGGE